MTHEQYETRARAIDTWAQAQYAAGTMTESAIERAVERMFDKLDAEYMPGAYVPDLYQTRADVDCEPDAYPGWHSMQSATRGAW